MAETQRIKDKRKLLLLLEFPWLFLFLSPPKVLQFMCLSTNSFPSITCLYCCFLLESSLSFIVFLSIVGLRNTYSVWHKVMWTTTVFIFYLMFFVYKENVKNIINCIVLVYLSRMELTVKDRKVGDRGAE